MAEAAWRRYLRFWRSNVDADVDDELRFHFEERIAALVADGLTNEEARWAAEREFGNVSAVRHDLRQIDRRVSATRQQRARFSRWREDFAYSARSLRRSPGLSLTIVATLALGLGVNVTLFSLLDRLLLRMPSGIASPKEVRRLYWTGRGLNEEPVALPYFSIPLVDAVRDATKNISIIAAYQSDKRRLGNDVEPTTVVTSASAGYFSVLGVRPAYGRFFTADEERIDAISPVAVVGDAFWRHRFGGSPADAVGQTIVIDKLRFTVVGVAPRGFTGADLDAADIWTPLGNLSTFEPYNDFGAVPWFRSSNLYAFQLLVRATTNDAGQLEAAATIGVRRGFAHDQWRKSSRVLSGPILGSRGPEARGQELAIAIRLGGVAIVVLLIACANVANLLLARAVQRRREIAVRTALGITRGGLVRLLLTESLLLALGAGVAAVVAAVWTAALLRALLFPSVHWSSPTVDWRVGLFALCATSFAGLAAGLLPAMRASRTDVSQMLKAGGREGSVHRSRTRAGLLMVQAALSTVLLVGAALFVRSLHAVRALDLGLDVQRLAFVWPHFEGGDRRANAAALGNALPELAARLEKVPGVERVALASMSPMYGFSFSTVFYANGDSLPKWSDGVPSVTGVSPAFFATTGLRILRGRGLTERDVNSGGVAVVNETLARSAWPHAEAVGQCLRLEKPSGQCLTVVGVVADARRSEILEKPVRQLYLAAPQTGAYSASSVIVRVRPDRSGNVEVAARREVPRLFPRAEADVVRMAEFLAPQYRPWELGATLFSLCGLLALVVAAVGVFSTLSHEIRQRRHELGVRVALGAGNRELIRLVLGGSIRTVGMGVVVGLGLALGAGRLIASQLYGVAPADPGAFLAVAAVLIATAAASGLAPAWRASRTDPMEALRAD